MNYHSPAKSGAEHGSLNCIGYWTIKCYYIWLCEYLLKKLLCVIPFNRKCSFPSKRKKTILIEAKNISSLLFFNGEMEKIWTFDIHYSIESFGKFNQNEALQYVPMLKRLLSNLKEILLFLYRVSYILSTIYSVLHIQYYIFSTAYPVVRTTCSVLHVEGSGPRTVVSCWRWLWLSIQLFVHGLLKLI